MHQYGTEGAQALTLYGVQQRLQKQSDHRENPICVSHMQRAEAQVRGCHPFPLAQKGLGKRSKGVILQRAGCGVNGCERNGELNITMQLLCYICWWSWSCLTSTV
jgi:hypothetical protein